MESITKGERFLTSRNNFIKNVKNCVLCKKIMLCIAEYIKYFYMLMMKETFSVVLTTTMTRFPADRMPTTSWFDFRLSISSIVMAYMHNPVPLTPPWQWEGQQTSTLYRLPNSLVTSLLQAIIIIIINVQHKTSFYLVLLLKFDQIETFYVFFLDLPVYLAKCVIKCTFINSR